jgi:hypothetical protein
MEPSTENSQGISAEQSAAPAPNPKRRFDSPEMLIADVGASDAEKLEMLKEWDLELDNRLKAEEEGFSASDPIRSRHEGAIADESARVKSALAEVAKRTDEPA